MDWPAWETIGLIVAIFLLLYYYSTSTFDFWEKRGVKGPKPVPFFGNFKDVLLGKCSVSDCFCKAYYDYKNEQLIGVFDRHSPLLIVKDPDFIKDILIKDFNTFSERTLIPIEEVEPLSVHLFRLDAARWRPLRVKLSPVFTSGKLKEMFYLMLECLNHFDKYLEKLVAKNEPIECREISAKFTTDVIGSCAFGIEMNAMNTTESEFRKMGRKVFETNWKTVVRDRLRGFPWLYRYFGRLLNEYELVDFFVDITKETIKYRIENNIQRHDFIDTLVDLKLHPEKLGLEEVTDIYAAAQAFVFFVAGFETSSITISNTLYELALNPAIQKNAREEVQSVLERTDGEITYDCINEMPYLNACFQETLRKYPVVQYISRIAQANYQFTGTKITIPKGQQVFLPVYAIQRDPEIYPNPDVFDPDRFTGENAKSRHPMYFLPFGDGPRNCIGARFAKIQSKVALIKILSKYKIDVCEKTQIPYIMDTRALFLLQPMHGIYLKMTKLQE